MAKAKPKERRGAIPLALCTTSVAFALLTVALYGVSAALLLALFVALGFYLGFAGIR